MRMMYVISKKDTKNFVKGRKYQVINADMYDYLIQGEIKEEWIYKADEENFEYHV